MKINHKAAINATFAALPDLEKVYIIDATGEHYFNKDHAKSAAGEKGKVHSLVPDAKELKEEAK